MDRSDILVGCKAHDDVINGNIFRVTGPLCGEFTGHRWIPHTKASDAELWCLICTPINGSVNNGKADNLRCHRAHYEVIVMTIDQRWQIRHVYIHQTKSDTLTWWKTVLRLAKLTHLFKIKVKFISWTENRMCKHELLMWHSKQCKRKSAA